ncbi:unnamed protein product [Amoebophrya sp. A120]|nr:unnamed protein product [Amoebophrya sp. A120]|eukprot:GSA120T00019373001.1
MGSYLSSPVTHKEMCGGESRENPFVGEVAGCMMQGWRKTMEDAHICLPDLTAFSHPVLDEVGIGDGKDGAAGGAKKGLEHRIQDQWKGHSLFAVFDGHGGADVAKFCASCVPMMLLRKDMEMTTSSSGASKGDCSGAKLESLLVDVHHRLDDLLRDDKYCRALVPTASNGNGAAGNGSGDSPNGRTTPGGATGPNGPALSLLQQSLQKDLAGAKAKGSLSTGQATNVMVKMMLLQQMTGGGKGGGMTGGGPGNKRNLELDDDIFSTEDDDMNSGSSSSSSSGLKPAELLQDLWESKSNSSTATSSTSASSSSSKTTDKDKITGKITDGTAADPDRACTSRSQSHPTAGLGGVMSGGLLAGHDRFGGGPPPAACIARLMGCTAVQALVTPEGKVIVANAGDSRCVVCQRDGHAHALSHDHKPDQQREQNRIHAAGGRVEVCKPLAAGGRTHHRVNGNLNLSRAIGDLEYKQRQDLPPDQQVYIAARELYFDNADRRLIRIRFKCEQQQFSSPLSVSNFLVDSPLQHQIICSTPDIITYDIAPGDDFLILACDGVWDMMTNQEACDFVRTRLKKGSALKQICADLLDACLADDPRKQGGLGGDNTTVLLVKLKYSFEARNNKGVKKNAGNYGLSDEENMTANSTGIFTMAVDEGGNDLKSLAELRNPSSQSTNSNTQDSTNSAASLSSSSSGRDLVQIAFS